MADVVQKNGNESALFFVGSDFMALVPKHVNGLLHQVHSPDGVVKTRMQCARINQVRQPKLLDAPQPLKPRVLN